MGGFEDFLAGFGGRYSAAQEREINRLDEGMAKQVNQSNRNAMGMFELQKQVMDLKDQNEQLALMFRTLYDACIGKDLFSKQEFRSLMDKIDGLDGKVDGKLSSPKE